MEQALQCRLLLGWSLVLLLATAAAEPLFSYTCGPIPQPKGGCDGSCQQQIGTALLQLHAGLKGAERNRPWHGEHAMTLCKQHCHAVPAYCGWPGVLCCHTKGDSRIYKHSAPCKNTDVEHELCPGNTAPGAVWKLDLTMQKLGGSLTDDVVDALKVLTGYGLHAIDFSRYAGNSQEGGQGGSSCAGEAGTRRQQRAEPSSEPPCAILQQGLSSS